jgi:hypothetical protein
MVSHLLSFDFIFRESSLESKYEEFEKKRKNEGLNSDNS